MNDIAQPFIAPRFIERFGSFEKVISAVLVKATNDVQQAERSMLAIEQSPCPVIHRFGPGIYIREVFMPAGTLAIGHEQRYEQMNVFLKGRVTMLGKNGENVDLVAPMAFVGPPGRKIGYIAEDMVWQNIYATEETDIEKLEAMFLVKDDVWSEDLAQRQGRTDQKSQADREDYLLLLNEFGITHERARAESEFEGDRVPFPYGAYKVMVTQSTIEGRGMFATADIEPGERIAPARISGKRTPAGRYVNHSASPNAEFVLLPNGDLDLVALEKIKGNQGGRTESEITIDYRQALKLRELPCQQLSAPQQ